MLECLRRFKPIENQPEKRPIGRPGKRRKTVGSESAPIATNTAQTVVDLREDTDSSTDSDEINDQHPTNEESGIVTLKKPCRGQYRSYNLQFKMVVVAEVLITSLAVVAEKYQIARSTIASWETQLRREKNAKRPDS